MTRRVKLEEDVETNEVECAWKAELYALDEARKGLFQPTSRLQYRALGFGFPSEGTLISESAATQFGGK